jgi:hypothetical protein
MPQEAQEVYCDRSVHGRKDSSSWVTLYVLRMDLASPDGSGVSAPLAIANLFVPAR